MSPAQEEALWEGVVAQSGEAGALLSLPRAARLAGEAWSLAHDWRITTRWRAVQAGEDARAFAGWAARYERLTARNGQIDQARLPEWLATRLAHGALRGPSRLVAYGFDILTPRVRDLFEALERAGTQLSTCAPGRRVARVRRVALVSPEAELRAAAQWARERLEARPEAQIGIVVPGLEQLRGTVQRVFGAVMDPGRLLRNSAPPPPFNISLGDPLPSYPIVAAAFLVLDIAAGEVPFAAASRFLRSPFIGGAQAELAARARLDAALRRISGDSLGIGALRRLIARSCDTDAPRRAPACPRLAQLIDALASLASRDLRGSRGASHWVRVIDQLLRAAGFPGDRPLDSVEYQGLAKWHELLAQFAALERVLPRIRFADALARLSRIAAQTLFQPEADAVPIQVMGVLESLGLQFDHLWVSGLTEEAWPVAPAPHPFIPLALQRHAGVPQASAAQCLALDRRITEAWCGAAGDVILSHALREDDREFEPSPLIAGLPRMAPEELGVPPPEVPVVLWRARRIETVESDPGPGLAAAAAGRAVSVAGGTALFRDQAACPFRALAVHRLGAEALEHPGPGLDARDRGTLLHAMLAKLWSQLKNKARLDSASERDLQAVLEQSAETALTRLRRQRPEVMGDRLVALERVRLVRIARQWLSLERQRSDFEVAAIEEKHAVEFGGVRVNVRLDRMDRIGGRCVVLDYKSGRANVGDWLGSRPDEPQLPLYAVGRSGAGAAPAVAGVAFAKLRPGDMGFRGLAAEEGLIPGVSLPAKRGAGEPWSALLDEWRAEFESLGREFAAGEARVAPKRGDASCRHCEARPLCRIQERAVASFGEAQDEA